MYVRNLLFKRLITMKNLLKNQEINLASQLNSNSFILAFNWDEPLTYEVDVSAVLLSENRMLDLEDNFIFYNNLSSPCGSVKIDSEPIDFSKSSITIDISKIPKDVSEVMFLLSIYDARDTKKSLSEIKNIRIDLFKPDKKESFFRYDLDNTKDSKNVASVIIMRLNRTSSLWKLKCDGYMLLLELDEILMKFVSEKVKISKEASKEKMLKEKRFEKLMKTESFDNKKIPNDDDNFVINEFNKFDKRIIEIESLIQIYDLKINDLFKKILDLFELKTKDMEYSLVKHTTELFMTLIENMDVLDQRMLKLDPILRYIINLTSSHDDEKKYLQLSEKISNLELKFQTYDTKLDKLTDGISELLEFVKKENKEIPNENKTIQKDIQIENKPIEESEQIPTETEITNIEEYIIETSPAIPKSHSKYIALDENDEPLKLEEEEKLCFLILLENISIDEELLKEKFKEKGFQSVQVKEIISSLIKNVNAYVKKMDADYDDLIEVISKKNNVIYTLSDLKFAKYINSKIS